MKEKLKKIIVAMLCIHITLNAETLVFAQQAETEINENEDIITIDNCGYTAQEFMQKVIECTKKEAPIILSTWFKLEECHIPWFYNRLCWKEKLF